MMKRCLFLVLIIISGLAIYSSTPETDCIPSIYPAKGFIVRSFGAYFDPLTMSVKISDSICMGTAPGIYTKISASAPGVVKSIEKKNPGYVVTIDHGCGYISRYAYPGDNLNVALGQSVKRFDIIGFIGTKGDKVEPVFYYKVEYNGAPIDPFSLIL
jgi:septal ring factor EnvC (AmiA/AmiB activator)